MEHLKQYGKFLTPELKDKLGVPLCYQSILSLDSEITLKQMDHHVVLGALILDRVYDEQRRYGFLDLTLCLKEAERLLAQPLNDNNSLPIVRNGKIAREHIQVFQKTSELFIAQLYDKNHYITNFLDTGKVAQFHPFVQFLYISEALEKGIAEMEESIPAVPAEAVDVPAF